MRNRDSAKLGLAWNLATSGTLSESERQRVLVVRTAPKRWRRRARRRTAWVRHQNLHLSQSRPYNTQCADYRFLNSALEWLTTAESSMMISRGENTGIATAPAD
jgi:hypothetical protein